MPDIIYSFFFSLKGSKTFSKKCSEIGDKKIDLLSFLGQSAGPSDWFAYTGQLKIGSPIGFCVVRSTLYHSN